MPPESLHIGPSVGSEGNLVDAQGWISIVVAVVIVIDENVAVGICEEALPSGPIDVSMGAEHDGSTA